MKIFDGGRVFLHEALAFTVDKETPPSPHAFGDEDMQFEDAGGGWKRFHVFHGDAAPVAKDGNAIASEQWALEVTY
ncbi:MAG: hypothetical protein IPK53_08605 [bacterium]|nr:hypothetical protein [bacterium]